MKEKSEDFADESEKSTGKYVKKSDGLSKISSKTEAGSMIQIICPECDARTWKSGTTSKIKIPADVLEPIYRTGTRCPKWHKNISAAAPQTGWNEYPVCQCRCQIMVYYLEFFGKFDTEICPIR